MEPRIENKKLIEYLRWNSFRSVNYRIFYVATPKVACTSLKWWFAELEGLSAIISDLGESNESSPDLVIHDAFQKIAQNATGLSLQELDESLHSDNYFRFAVVRNPYKRIFSAWQSKLLLQEPLQIKNYLNEEFFNYKIKSIADLAKAFELFLEYLANREAPNFLDSHWTPQAVLLCPEIISYNQIAQIECLGPLVSALTKIIGPDAPTPFSFQTNESLISYAPNLITDKAAEIIQSLYAIDFEQFGYNPLKPEGINDFSMAQLELALRAVNIIRGRHRRLSDLRQKKSDQINDLNNTLSERGLQINRLDKKLYNRDSKIKTLNQLLSDRDVQIRALNLNVSDRDSQITSLLHDVKTVRDEIAIIRNSNSWRITKPLRSLRQYIISRPYAFIRRKYF